MAEAPGPHPGEPDEPVRFAESGGSWWAVLPGPVLIGAVLVVEIAGPGQVHWPVLSIFFVILTGFAAVQVYAANTHVSMSLTDTTLTQGTQVLPVADIVHIFPPNTGEEAQRWESAPALGELSGVPRRRTGIGLELASGSLAQAWARDHRRFRTELTEAHLAMSMRRDHGDDR